jgi:hypothetical protein
MNGVDHGEGSLKNFYGYRETFEKETTWVSIPQQLTFVHTTNPYEDEENELYVEGDTSFVTNDGSRNDDTVAVNDDIEIMGQLAKAAFPAYQGLEALSTVASRDQYTYAPVPPSIGQHDSPSTQQDLAGGSANNAASMSQNLDFILNPSAGNGNIDPRLHGEMTESSPTGFNGMQEKSPQHVRTLSYASSQGRPSLRAQGSRPHRDRGAAIENPELAFLLRDFAEHCGSWMDLFELNLFFSANVPLLAVQCPLLLYSCTALAAKSIARVDGRRQNAAKSTEFAERNTFEAWPGRPMSVADWYQRAREYYDLAVSLLRQALAGAVRPPTASLPEHTSPSSVFTVQNQPLPTTDSDELVAATAILCVYEFLDASTPEWSRHLDGAKSLFDIANDRMVHMTLPPSPHAARTPASQSSNLLVELPHKLLGPGRRAVFWCFARQDMLCAFINNSRTRLDTFDLEVWRSAGLKIMHCGLVCPSNPDHPDYQPENAMPDDMVGNALVWVLAKLVNFIAAGDDVPESISPLGLGMRQQQLLEYWEKLDEELRAWYEGLPDSFKPTAVVSSSQGMDMEEKWFPRPACASTAQWWHFARIQLLYNKPHLSTATPASRGRLGLAGDNHGSSLASRHASYASIIQQSREHAKEIVAIGLGRSDEGARVHSVQPLWTAGLVLGGSDGDVDEETWMWRRCVLGLLRGIERDMGWASGYRVRSLLEQWELPPDFS